ncbi:hypothetical protein GCM10009809_17860 [Isoptericola hypogeus]|uniref:ASCH domain-containing protein n=1 Tax=Isoptericola hypogeus TaxID=300179 RepID=A0ABN2JCI1_9MICO
MTSPTIRARIPVLIARRRRSAGAWSSESASWPARTTFTSDDVWVDGLSLAAVAASGETPIVVTGRTKGCVLLVHVDVVVPRLGRTPRQVWVDADLSHGAVRVEHARALGHHTDRLARWAVRSAYRESGHDPVRLPEDLGWGDVVAVPCLADLTVSDVAL